MTIQFRCHHCSKRIEAPDSASGRNARCPVCGQSVEVPTIKKTGDNEDPFAGFEEFLATHGANAPRQGGAPPQQPPPPPPQNPFEQGGGLPDSILPSRGVSGSRTGVGVQRTPMQGIVFAGGLILVVLYLLTFLAVGSSLASNDPHSNRDPGSTLATLIFAPPFILAGLVFYICPSIIAYSREHENFVPILIINLVFGWILVGWVASLAWAFSSNVRESRQYIRHVIVREPDFGP